MNQLLILIPLLFGSPQEAPATTAPVAVEVHAEHEAHDEHAEETPEEHAEHAEEEAGGHGSEPWPTELGELLRNPAHWIFEWINDFVSWAIIFVLGRAYVKYRERRAVSEHDAKFHPHSHRRVDNEPEA